MKKTLFFLFVFLLVFIAASCGDKRPGNSETFQITISGTSILHNAEVTLTSDGKEVATTTTNEEGTFELSDIESATGLNISVCKGAFHSVAADSDVNFTGCLQHYIPQTAENVSVVVDFLSSFITKYNEILEEKTALEEWSEYLSMTTSPVPELQSSLTDATKRYLWQQGLSKIAESISVANEITPESMYSTENLFNLLIADLVDDAVINGSTNAKFGTLEINAIVLKNLIADAIPEVSETFNAADLEDWTNKIRYSDAKFLGGEGTGEMKNEIQISMEIYPEGNKGAHPDFYSGRVTVEAVAEPENLVLSLKCYANGEEIQNDSNANNEFTGEFSTEIAVVEDNDEFLSVTIRCAASDGITMKENIQKIFVDNEAPETTATFFEIGTNIVTGTEENPAQSRVDLKVQASHNKYAIDEVSCSIENYTMKNTATANYQFAAVVDTTELPEGKNLLQCIVSMNQAKFTTNFDFYVKNTVSVAVKPFITNALNNVKSVDIDCGSDFTGHYTELQGIKLKRGQICKITVSGGSYESITLSENEEDLREFVGNLSAVVIPESDADIIVSPITTIDEIVYSSRIAAGEDGKETFDKSKESLLNHFSKSFAWNEEPKNTKSMDSGTKYYILLAGLENLAYFLEMQIDADHGSYSVSNIIELMRDDYSDKTFDGKKNGSKLVFGTEKTFELDSNFFRYYYATAIKRFLNSDFNKTTIKNVGSMLNQIALNSDQYLFPAESETIAIESDGPIFEITSFQNLYEYIPTDENDIPDIVGEIGFYIPLEDETAYNPNKTTGYPYFPKAFILNFTLKPNKGNFIDLNSLKFSENDSAKFEYTRLAPAKIQGDGFTNEDTEFSFLVEYDDSDRAANEKQINFTVSASDVAFNEGAASVKTFLDSKAPIIDLSLLKTLTNGNDNFRIIFDVSDNALVEVEYCLKQFGFETDAETGDPLEVLRTVKCSVDTFSDPKQSYNSEIAVSQVVQYIDEAFLDGTILEKDGKFLFEVTATDRAGNKQTETEEFELDTTPPLNYAVYSYNNKSNIYLAEVFSSFDNLNPPSWVYISKSTSVKVELSYWSQDREDIESWNVKLKCCPNDDDYLNFFDDCSNSSAEWFTKSNLSVDDTAVFEGLPENASCKGQLQVCDKLTNCSEYSTLADNLNQTDLINAFYDKNQHYKLPKVWFKTSNNPPEFDHYTAERTECNKNICHSKPLCALSKEEKAKVATGAAAVNPNLMLKFTTEPEVVKIKSAEGAWNDRFCDYRSESNCDNMFFCDLADSVTGINNVIITACDMLDNCSTTSLSLDMDMNAVAPINLKLTRDFFTEKTNSSVSWTTKSGVSYTCKISKQGDTAYSQSCTNGQTIKTANLNGTGIYTITVNSSSSTTKRTDTATFTFFNTSDLTTNFKPIAGQVLKKNDTFKFDSFISSQVKLAQITKIQYYLYGLYKSGTQSDTTERLIKTDSYSTPISNYNNTVSTNLSLDVSGRLQNLRAKITFADGTTITRNSTSTTPYLYCMLGSDEKIDDITLSFSNSLLVKYNKPSCLKESEYKLSVETKNLQSCNSIPTGTRPGQNTPKDDFNVSYGDGAFSINATHTLYSYHPHSAGGGAQYILGGCYADIKAFSKNTTAILTVNNKTYKKTASFDWNNVKISGWEHITGGHSCKQGCGSLPTTLSCKDSSETKTFQLK